MKKQKGVDKNILRPVRTGSVATKRFTESVTKRAEMCKDGDV